MRKIMATLLATAFLAGCEQPKLSMDMFAQPEPAPQLKRLDNFVGTWAGNAEMVSPTAEEMSKMMAGGEEFPSEFKGGGSSEWMWDGRFLKSEGWHEMPNGDRVNYIEFMTWDPTIKKFRTWYFSDYGEFGQGTATLTEDGKSMTMKAKGVDAQGQRMSGSGTAEFLDDNTMHWTWTEGGLWHKMKLKGTSKRQY